MNKEVGTEVQKTEIRGDPLQWLRKNPLPAKVGTKFADKWQLLGQYSSHAD
jgi:hypothetical protein